MWKLINNETNICVLRIYKNVTIKRIELLIKMYSLSELFAIFIRIRKSSEFTIVIKIKKKSELGLFINIGSKSEFCTFIKEWE